MFATMIAEVTFCYSFDRAFPFEVFAGAFMFPVRADSDAITTSPDTSFSTLRSFSYCNHSTVQECRPNVQIVSVLD